VNAILFDEPLMVTASMGLGSLDIANAMLLSTWQDTAVDMPLDRHAYQPVLEEKVASSSLRKKSGQQANVDMNASYR
jgi:hypothetical protein